MEYSHEILNERNDKKQYILCDPRILKKSIYTCLEGGSEKAQVKVCIAMFSG
jgi:hypothetical protein